jgi:peptidylprolyl isomerase
VKPLHLTALGLVAACVLSGRGAAQGDWEAVAPERILAIDTTKGRLLVEMRPDLAPQSVARVMLLARERVYDGLQFHRVVPNFVVQTGNPNNRDGGVSAHANLPPEFVFRFKPGGGEVMATTANDTVAGFFGSVPFQGVSLVEGSRRSDGLVRGWGAYCPGVAGMGRQAARDTGNSEIFFMLEASRNLDHDYSAWGRIIDGFPVLLALATGSPPAQPDLMTRVRVLADLPAAERPVVSLPSRTALSAIIARARTAKGADFSVCDVDVPARVTPPRGQAR